MAPRYKIEATKTNNCKPFFRPILYFPNKSIVERVPSLFGVFACDISMAMSNRSARMIMPLGFFVLVVMQLLLVSSNGFLLHTRTNIVASRRVPRCAYALSDWTIDTSDDPFVLLGIARTDNDKRTIKMAYKRAALKYHPDIVLTQNASAEEKKQASDRFAKINWAYSELQLTGESKTNGSESSSTTTTAEARPSQSHWAQSTTTASDNNSPDSNPWQSRVHRAQPPPSSHYTNRAAANTHSQTSNDAWIHESFEQMGRNHPNGNHHHPGYSPPTNNHNQNNYDAQCREAQQQRQQQHQQHYRQQQSSQQPQQHYRQQQSQPHYRQQQSQPHYRQQQSESGRPTSDNYYWSSRDPMPSQHVDDYRNDGHETFETFLHSRGRAAAAQEQPAARPVPDTSRDPRFYTPSTAGTTTTTSNAVTPDGRMTLPLALFRLYSTFSYLSVDTAAERLAAGYLANARDHSRLPWQHVRQGWGSWTNFMISYGLKPWRAGDLQAALDISRGLHQYNGAGGGGGFR
jgi:DnaJ-domain-containing protein 1